MQGQSGLRRELEAPLDTTVDVDTPERLLFSFRLAGPAQRAGAYTLDLMVRGGVLMGIGILGSIASAFGPDGFSGIGMGVVALGLFLVEWVYFVVSELTTNGQSLGKRALGLRVVRSDGLPIGFSESVLRNLLRAADFLPFGYAVGALSSLLDTRFRRLGDLAASTMVVVESKHDILPPVVIRPPASTDELERLPMRPDLGDGELEAIEVFLRRQEAFNALRADELAELVAPVFARRLGLRYRSASRLLGLLYERARGARP